MVKAYRLKFRKPRISEIHKHCSSRVLGYKVSNATMEIYFESEPTSSEIELISKLFPIYAFEVLDYGEVEELTFKSKRVIKSRSK